MRKRSSLARMSWAGRGSISPGVRCRPLADDRPDGGARLGRNRARRKVRSRGRSADSLSKNASANSADAVRMAIDFPADECACRSRAFPNPPNRRRRWSQVGFGSRQPFAQTGQAFVGLREIDAGLRRFAFAQQPILFAFADQAVGLFGPGLHLLGVKLRLFGLATGVGPNSRAIRRFAGPSRRFRWRLSSTSSFNRCAVGDAGARGRPCRSPLRSFRDFLLETVNRPLQRLGPTPANRLCSRSAVPMRASSSAMSWRNSRNSLFSRKDTGFGVVGADRERAVRLQQFAVAGDEAKTGIFGFAAAARAAAKSATIRVVESSSAGRWASSGRSHVHHCVGPQPVGRRSEDGGGMSLMRTAGNRRDRRTAIAIPNCEIEPGGIADQKALRPVAQSEIDQRGDIAWNGQTIGDQTDDERPIFDFAIERRPGFARRFIHQFQHFADAGAEPFLSAFECSSKSMRLARPLRFTSMSAWRWRASSAWRRNSSRSSIILP